MFKSHPILMSIAVLFSIGFISLMVWYVNTKIPSTLKNKDWLTRFVALTLTVILGLFVVDILVSWDIQLLDDNLRNSLFELIKNIVLVVFGYQFNANTKEDKS